MTKSRDSAASLLRSASFRHPWRGYQQRVIDELDSHLGDRRLHVVAPPGSGKTVLGLEVVRRIGRPALILTPTLTVREQWLGRLEADFLGGCVPLGAVSRDLMSPSTVTATTYQALASVFRAGESRLLIDALREAQVETLVVDEAHHLRSHWWSCLLALEKELEQLHVVSLTATPPFDAPQIEWNRYATFCGPVDEEIGVPELVRSGDLCPHQDYLYLCLPTERDAVELRSFRGEVRRFLSELSLDTELAAALACDPRLAHPEDHIDAILSDAELFLGVAVFLNGLMWEAPRALLEVMGLGQVKLPAWDLDWAEVMLNRLLFDPSWETTASGEHLTRLRRRLKQIGAIERRKVLLTSSLNNQRLLRASPSKVESVCRIVELESECRDAFRIVVLTDHVRASLLPVSTDVEPLVKLGVIPIFEALRRRQLTGVRPAILTGSIVVIPADTVASFLGGDVGARVPATQPLEHAPGHVRIDLSSADRQGAVRRVTALLERGAINLIVGTTALLGEGWDAPAVDTIILATAVGSYVTSNQLRGRAIRSHRDAPDKIANIWHLACVEPVEPQDASSRAARSGGGTDLEILRRRFDAFVGIASDAARIESGLSRLEVEGVGLDPSNVDGVNRAMARMAEDREGVRERWRLAVDPTSGREGRLVRELTAPSRLLAPRLRVLREARGGLLASLSSWFARRRLFRIAAATVDALAASGLISATPSQLAVSVSAGRPGRCTVRLSGAGYLDQARFVAALDEVFERLSWPRYLVRRRRDYYAVPSSFGGNRAAAERFHGAFQRHVGRAQLIFTRNRAGKRHLLQAMESALLRRFEERVEVGTTWSLRGP